jgi:hypothetical protein
VLIIAFLSGSRLTAFSSIQQYNESDLCLGTFSRRIFSAEDSKSEKPSQRDGSRSRQGFSETFNYWPLNLGCEDVKKAGRYSLDANDH